MTNVKQIDGDWLIYRKRGPKGLSKEVGGSKLPSFRHKSYEAAEVEAERLLALFPDSTFIIMREVATVKRRDVE